MMSNVRAIPAFDCGSWYAAGARSRSHSLESEVQRGSIRLDGPVTVGPEVERLRVDCCERT